MSTPQHRTGPDGASPSRHACLVYPSPAELDITGMLERARGIGGTLEDESEPGRGTGVRARPLPDAQ